MRYLAGETEEMIETKETKSMGTVTIIEDISPEGDVTIVDGTTDEDVIGDDIFYFHDGFIRDIASVIADVVVDRIDDKDDYTSDKIRYIHEQILEIVDWSLATADFSVESFEKWWGIENGIYEPEHD